MAGQDCDAIGRLAVGIVLEIGRDDSVDQPAFDPTDALRCRLQDGAL